jgi:hypothetical protein
MNVSPVTPDALAATLLKIAADHDAAANAQLAADRDALDVRAADVEAKIERLSAVRAEFAKAS